MFPAGGSCRDIFLFPIFSQINILALQPDLVQRPLN